MSLVLFSSFVGMILAPGTLHPFIGFVAMFSVALASGASGAINMWYDRDIDSIMSRTQKRPLVQNKISPDDALAFGVVLAFFSVFVMSICVNYLSGFLLLITILFYVFIYTIWLKRTSVQNIVIGGLSGALPPLIGWSSVTNSISLEPLILVLIIFLWTPPHFWALSLYRSDDYRKAGVPMMPVIYGDEYTKSQILIYTLLTFASSLLPFVVGLCSHIYLGGCIVLGLYFVYLSTKLIKDRENKSAPKLFIYSIFYLFSLFLTMLIDHYAYIKIT
jgi:protoheme IX farnesyltransferase